MIDRQPTKPNRIKLTSETDGKVSYYTMERADEPTATGTPLNKNTLFNSKNTDRYGCELPAEAFEKIANEWIVNIPLASWSASADSAGWFTNRITVSGMKAVYNPLAVLVISSAAKCDDEQSAWAVIKEIITEDGAIVCHALEKPEMAINIRLSGV